MSSNQSPSPKRGLQEGPRWPNGSTKHFTSAKPLKSSLRVIMFAFRSRPTRDGMATHSSNLETRKKQPACRSLSGLRQSAWKTSGRGLSDGPGLLLQTLRQGVPVVSGGSGTVAPGSGHSLAAVVRLLSGREHPERSRGAFLALWGQACVATFVRTIVATSVRTVFQTEPRRWPLFPPAGTGAGAQSAGEGFSRKRWQGKRGGSSEGSRNVNVRSNVRSNSHSHSHRSTSPIAPLASFPSQETKPMGEPVHPQTPAPAKNAPGPLQEHRRTHHTPAPRIASPERTSGQDGAK